MKEISFSAIFRDIISYLEGLIGADGVNGTADARQHICTCIRNMRENMEKRYTEINNYIKTNFMKSVEGEIVRLDRHKCAAALMIAFLEQPIDIKTPVIPTMKERLAIRIGLSIMLTMIMDMNGKGIEETQKDAAFSVFLKNNKNTFNFPKVLSDDNPYEQNWESELYFARKENKLFILSLANELFCIEKYNRMIAGVESV
jgi:hypothetical protein